MEAEGILSVIQQLDLRASKPYNSKKWGPHVSVACPLAPWTHSDPHDHNKSCSISIDPDGPSYAKCWSFNCNYSGSFVRLIQTAIGKRPDAEKWLPLLEWLVENDRDDIEVAARRAAQRIDQNWNQVQSAVTAVAGPGARPPIGFDQDVLDEGIVEHYKGRVPQYAFDRGLDLEACRTWELGYDASLKRLVFPVRDFSGRLVGITGRILPSAAMRAEIEGREVTKYHNYSGLPKTRHLYGAWLWKKERPLVIVEGPLDAGRTWMALNRRDINVGATLGQGFSDDHRRVVAASWPTAVYIFGDDDTAGRLMAEKIHDALKRIASTFLMRCPKREMLNDKTGEMELMSLDPGLMTDEEINTAFDTAEPILDQIAW